MPHFPVKNLPIVLTGNQQFRFLTDHSLIVARNTREWYYCMLSFCRTVLEQLFWESTRTHLVFSSQIKFIYFLIENILQKNQAYKLNYKIARHDRLILPIFYNFLYVHVKYSRPLLRMDFYSRTHRVKFCIELFLEPEFG
jgi:hypothetical protein